MNTAQTPIPGRARRRRPDWRRIAGTFAIVLGFVYIADAFAIHTKAWLAQTLIEHAWSRNLETGRAAARPWRWADTTPVARLHFVRQDRDQVVLAGDSGRVLAFGPGHRDGTPLPGEAGNSVVSGHRDTHFSVLRELTAGDPIEVQNMRGERVRYEVDGARVVDHRDLRVLADDGQDTLTLITCWPFDALRPGGPGRYVVTARRIG
ncbi:MAG: class GN sortase [Burkholderiaceae bacterium]